MIDIQQLIPILKDLGLPTALSAVVTVLVKAVSSARQRNSKEALLKWLATPSMIEPFQGDTKALQALQELQQTLIFERAFGLKADSRLRNELLLYAESERNSIRFQEVLEAGRIVARLSFARQQSRLQIKTFKIFSSISKPVGYVYVGIGYILFIGGMYLPDAMDWSGRLELASIAVGLVFGALATAAGIFFLRQARRFQIAGDFLEWRTNGEVRLSRPLELMQPSASGHHHVA